MSINLSLNSSKQLKQSFTFVSKIKRKRLNTSEQAQRPSLINSQGDRDMQAASSSETIGCIGKCMSGLTVEELDQITDNISKTLSHPMGRWILAKYLEQNKLKSGIDCLDLYNDCSDFLAKAQSQLRESYAESLARDVTTLMEKVDSVNGVEQLNIVLLQQFDEALTSGTREALLAVIEETRSRARDYLRGLHEDFKRYASEPCPLTKGYKNA